MTQEELKLGEACRAARKSLGPEIKAWVKSVVDDALTTHPSNPTELSKTLEAALQKRIVPDLVSRAMNEVQNADLFNTEQRLTIREQVNFWLKTWQPSVPINLPQPQWQLHNVNFALTLGALSGLGLLIGLGVSQSSWLPGSLSLLFSVVGCVLLVGIAQANTREKTGLAGWLSQPLPPTESNGTTPHDAMLQVSQTSLLHVLSLVEAAGRLEMLHQEVAPTIENTDSLTLLFDKCKDGLAEAYYSDLKRDPERALDACIKLMGDLQAMGIEIVTHERGEAFTTELEESFACSGQLKEGEPAVMLFPAWRLQGELLSKGLLKRSRRPAKKD